MAKKKTMVVMPGGLAGLAHNAQRGSDSPSATNNDENAAAEEAKKAEQAAAAEAERMAAAEEAAKKEAEAKAAQQPVQAESFTRHAAQTAQNDVKDRTAPAAKKLPKAEGRQLAREYTIAKDSGEDSWQLFLDLARDYKARDSRLATVYIDSDLKSVLDRLKSASSIKLPSTALLSAIVARFVFDHEKDIKNAIFGESLL
jgi:hypothetical protein